MHCYSYGKIIQKVARPNKICDLQESMFRMNEQSLQAKAVLAQNLKAYRIFFKMSQLEMAKHVHMSYRGYGKLERMEVAASLDTLDKIADYLGLSPAMLLCQDMIRFLADVVPKKKRKRSKDAEEHEQQAQLEDDIDDNEAQLQSEECADSSEEDAQFEENIGDTEELTPFEADVDSREMMVQLDADIDIVELLQSEEDVDDSEA